MKLLLKLVANPLLVSAIAELPEASYLSGEMSDVLFEKPSLLRTVLSVRTNCIFVY